MTTTTIQIKPASALEPCILVVDDEPTLIELIGDVVARETRARMISARTMAEARQILATQAIELLVADVHLPDGDGLCLIADLQRRHPRAGAIVITGSPSMDGAIRALRHGAVDFVPKPFSADQLLDRVQAALKQQAMLARENRRLARLRGAMKRLNEARRVVNRKVDLLCNDLVNAYGELSRELHNVRTQENFRHCLTQATDLEQMLCHAMDWLLGRVGYSNIALWLAADDRSYQLGAYMKYTIAAEPDLVKAMENGIVPLTGREGVVLLGPEEVQQCLAPAELDYLADQDVLGICCSYLGEPLAVMVLFRDGQHGFTDQDAADLEQIGPIFATALAAMVRRGDSGGAVLDEEGGGDGDWWKRGEAPPF